MILLRYKTVTNISLKKGTTICYISKFQGLSESHCILFETELLILWFLIIYELYVHYDMSLLSCILFMLYNYCHVCLSNSATISEWIYSKSLAPPPRYLSLKNIYIVTVDTMPVVLCRLFQRYGKGDTSYATY